MPWRQVIRPIVDRRTPFRTLKTLQAHQWLAQRFTMSTKLQPHWLEPAKSVEEPVLRVYNSLTHSKTPFVPRNGRHVKWYNCGPTVYDASHMGHARNYVTQDVLRRILVDYFGYDVHFVMNITDIDDKIILRARQMHLLQTFVSQTASLTPALLDQVRSSWMAYFHSKLPRGLPDDLKLIRGEEDAAWEKIAKLSEMDAAWKAACVARDEKFEMYLTSLRIAYQALRSASILAFSPDTSSEKSQRAAQELIEASRDILSVSLDAQYGHSITDPSIPRSLAAFWEAEFMKDMSRLRVRPPDTLTRVTEYVPEIVSFVETIIRRGYAYEYEGSVYFDTRAFDNGQVHTSSGEEAEWRHIYAKIEPWSKGNQKLMEEGEGALSKSSTRYPADFALWKTSKPGEPSWSSPWGDGRPGWHIECSVMASEILGENMDIHSGGIDLAFPHHDNEIAQSEAYHDCRQWVNYFLHTGHLHIEGLKMSKSLKNFITIDQILQSYTARQIRLAFLLVLWNAKVDFQESVMTGEVRTIETTFDGKLRQEILAFFIGVIDEPSQNFFAVVKAFSAQAAVDESYRSVYKTAERELADALIAAQTAFRVALCDSFNTPQALEVLLKIVSRTNIYITLAQSKSNVGVLKSVAGWVGKMLRMFGLGEGPEVEGMLGWGSSTVEGESAALDKEAVLMPYLHAFSAFRDNVRNLAMTQAPPKQVLEFCDKFRDADLVPLGVALDDQEDGRALVKLVPAATLMRLRDEKLAAAESKQAKKAAAVEAEREKRRLKMEKGKTPPEEMFKPPHTPQGVYGSWDEKGLPLTDAEGVELNKSRSKKLNKEWELQRKLHEEWKVWVEEEQG